MTPEDVVRAYFAAYSDGHPERFDELVSPEYVDYGHTTPGHGPQGARDDYEHAVELAGGLIRLVTSGRWPWPARNSRRGR